MKKITFFMFAIMCSIQLINAQNNYCNPLINPQLLDPTGRPVSTFFEPSVALDPNATEPDDDFYDDQFADKKYVYKVVFHVIRKSDHTRQTGDVGEPEIMNAVRDMNLNYNQFNIFFKYGGFDYVDSDDLVGSKQHTQLMSIFASAIIPNAFNIVIMDGDVIDVVNGQNVNVPAGSFFVGTAVFVNTFGMNTTRIVSHEIGHCFNLKHDFLEGEHVVRDQSLIGYNALDFDGGDRVHDTPATKIWPDDQYVNGVYEGGDYDGNEALDINNPERYYKTHHPRNNNLLHVHDGADLASGYFLTPGQGHRIRYYLSFDQTEEYNTFVAAEVPMAELFQPFESMSFAGDGEIIIEKDDDVATVCHPRVNVHRFQKGFNYIFSIDAGSQDIFAVPDDLMAIVGPTGPFNVKIAELEEDGTGVAEVVGTDGLICEDEEFQAGLIYALGMLGATPINIIQLNEMQVKDPHQYEQLLAQYYNVVKKITTSGAILEKVIYKP